MPFLQWTPILRGNMLSPTFDAVGIAAVPGPYGWWYAVQMFVSRPPAGDVVGSP